MWLSVWVLNAQTVPAGITKYLDANHAGWKLKLSDVAEEYESAMEKFPLKWFVG